MEEHKHTNLRAWIDKALEFRSQGHSVQIADDPRRRRFGFVACDQYHFIGLRSVMGGRPSDRLVVMDIDSRRELLEG